MLKDVLHALSLVATIVAANAPKALPTIHALAEIMGPMTGIVKPIPPTVAINATPAKEIHKNCLFEILYRQARDNTHASLINKNYQYQISHPLYP